MVDHLHDGDVQRHVFSPKEQGGLGQEYGYVVGSTLVRGLPHVGADEHRLHPEYALPRAKTDTTERKSTLNAHKTAGKLH